MSPLKNHNSPRENLGVYSIAAFNTFESAYRDNVTEVLKLQNKCKNQFIADDKLQLFSL